MLFSKKVFTVSILGVALIFAVSAIAQSAPTLNLGSVDVSGSLDGYYSYNQNRPSDFTNAGQTNQLYNFNDKTDQFGLSSAKLTFSREAEPVGFRFDLAFGRTNEIMSGAATNASWSYTPLNNNYQADDQGKYIQQAYITYKPTNGKGFQADFGKFATSAGAEVIDARDNWNYSRSLLFVNALPYFHFGLRTSMPTSKNNTVGVQVVNGWNNVSKDNGGVTIGLTEAYVTSKYGFNLNYYTGPENNNTQNGYRNLIDATVTLTPTSKLSAYVNYDFVQNRSKYVTGTFVDAKIQGIAAASKYQLTKAQAVSGRYEYMVGLGSIVNPLTNQEATLTYEYTVAKGLVSRLEYRHDWADRKIFTKGETDGAVKAQSTLTVAFIVYFGKK